jgi:branched-subunit amino acid aminotransferase/4-amino-4-deoxychorismate lyase
MKTAWLWTGTGFEPCAGVPVSDRGFRYGMALFETVCIRAGAPVFLPEHLARLRLACDDCAFALDVTALPQVERLLDHAGILHGVARIYVTAGDGPVTAPAEACRILVFCEPREPLQSRTYHRGYDLGLEEQPHLPLFGGLKTANYWANLDAFQRGVARQKNETLLFNLRGELISACMANVFVVKDGKILTPSVGCGARAGIVRDWMIRRHGVGEGILIREDLSAADEIFLTSSWIGVMPVASVEGLPLPSMAAARALHRTYEVALDAAISPGG